MSYRPFFPGLVGELVESQRTGDNTSHRAGLSLRSEAQEPSCKERGVLPEDT